MSDRNGEPLNNAGNGGGNHDNRGRFAPGNKAGKGNPLNRKAQQLRSAFIEAVTRADMVEIAKKLVAMAKAGDVQAAREVLDRCLGRPTDMATEQRIEDLEHALAQRQEQTRWT